MNNSDKKILYELIKTASDNFYGFSSIDFEEKPAVQSPVNNQAVNKPDSKPETTAQKIEIDSKVAAIITSQNAQENISVQEISLEELNSKIKRCSNCPECSNGKGKILSENRIKDVPVLVISTMKINPEESELLKKMLGAIGLLENKNCSITSILKCIPSRIPDYQELECCRIFVESEIAHIKPKFILFLSQLSANILTNQNNPIEAYRGKTLQLGSIPFTAIYSPEAVIKATGLKRAVWEDLKILKAELLKICPDYEA